jgi:small subunit ribosomal protein S7
MARRKSVNFIRSIGVDPKYGSETVQKLINIVMWRGKKNVARTIIYDAFDVLVKKMQGDQDKALKLFHKAIDQIVPVLEVRPRRVGGSVYQVPTEVNSRRALSLGLRWLVSAASSRSDKTMGLRLGNEIFDAAEGRGAAIKKRQDVHKMAEANRAFSHYSW